MADILGTAGDDTLTGTADPDVITGGDGNDIIDGNVGSDDINGGDGNDTIDGNFGNDTIDGGSGDDSILGAPGNDTLTGGAGNDEVMGGGGNDVIDGSSDAAVGANEADILTGMGGSDTFILGSNLQAYYVEGGDSDFARITDFNPGVDEIQLYGLPSDYSLTQVEADVELRLQGELIAVLENQNVGDLDLTADYFTYVGSGVNLVGTDADEVFVGTDAFDVIQGGGGNDTIEGGTGRDTLNGDDGADTISGGGDNDILNGGLGDDVINGDDGDDVIDAGFNDDTVEGGAGDDVINGAPGADILSGGTGNDQVSGGNQDDVINGTDSIAAGAGEVDRLTGGADSDRFILGDESQVYYVAAGDADYARITDFTGQDVIQLQGQASDYSLVQFGTEVELRFNGELIAILENQTVASLDLNSTSFEYLTSVPTNTPPVAEDDAFTTAEDATLALSVADLLANDSDVDLSDTLQIIDIGNATNGTVAFNDQGDIVFTPESGFSGDATFEYTLSDGVASSKATVSVVVDASVNTAPMVDTPLQDFVVTDNAPNSVIDLFSIFSDGEDADADLTYALIGNTNSSLFTSTVIDAEAGTLTLDYARQTQGSTDLTIRATDTSGAFADTSFSISVLDATPWSDTLQGGAGNDALRGGFGSDVLLGLGGDDRLLGGGGSDWLKGHDGNDILEGASRLTAGLFERDILSGGAGQDTFVLGNQYQSYYSRGYSWDYANIVDFNAQEDKIQLQGTAANYRAYGSRGNTYLYKVSRYSWYLNHDLVAVVQGNESLNLQSDSFEFVG